MQSLKRTHIPFRIFKTPLTISEARNITSLLMSCQDIGKWAIQKEQKKDPLSVLDAVYFNLLICPSVYQVHLQVSVVLCKLSYQIICGLLVHGQLTIIFVVFVGLSVCLSVCAEFFSAVFDPILIKLGHMLYVWV